MKRSDILNVNQELTRDPICKLILAKKGLSFFNVANTSFSEDYLQLYCLDFLDLEKQFHQFYQPI